MLRNPSEAFSYLFKNAYVLKPSELSICRSTRPYKRPSFFNQCSQACTHVLHVQYLESIVEVCQVPMKARLWNFTDPLDYPQDLTLLQAELFQREDVHHYFKLGCALDARLYELGFRRKSSDHILCELRR